MFRLCTELLYFNSTILVLTCSSQDTVFLKTPNVRMAGTAGTAGTGRNQQFKLTI